jgi:hypothetical protein
MAPVTQRVGVLAGLAPDLDLQIQSFGDPLVAERSHRHLTDSLPFSHFGPLGGVLMTLFLLWWGGARQASGRTGGGMEERIGCPIPWASWIG